MEKHHYASASDRREPGTYDSRHGHVFIDWAIPRCNSRASHDYGQCHVESRAALKESPAIANEWQDLRFIVETTVDGLERGWRDNAKKKDLFRLKPQCTLWQAISWDLRNAHTIGGEPSPKSQFAVSVRSASRFSETPCKNLMRPTS